MQKVKAMIRLLVDAQADMSLGGFVDAKSQKFVLSCNGSNIRYAFNR